MQIKSFTFNPFSENTYVLYDETGECVIVDPGCYFPDEEAELSEFIDSNKLTVRDIILTHAHIDHICGCDYVSKKYQVGITMHKDDLFLLQRLVQTGAMYGIPVKECPEPTRFIDETETFRFGNTVLYIRFAPGHSPGSIIFIHTDSKSIISGDVIFNRSIGRSDLPGGDETILFNSIREQIFTLPDDYNIYSGHGPVTNVGYEKKFNPYCK